MCVPCVRRKPRKEKKDRSGHPNQDSLRCFDFLFLCPILHSSRYHLGYLHQTQPKLPHPPTHSASFVVKYARNAFADACSPRRMRSGSMWVNGFSHQPHS